MTIEATALDAANAVAMKQALQDGIESPGGSVAIDLTKVDLVDSAGIGVLLGVSKYNEAKIALWNVQPDVLGVIKLLRLERFFEIQRR